MSFLKKIFGTKPGGSFVGNLFRSAVKMVPIVGNVVGAGLDADFAKRQQQLADKEASKAIAEKPPTVENIKETAGFPEKSAVFQQGQAENPYMLNEVKITPQRQQQSANIDLDWKNGRIKYGNNPTDQNNMMMFGLLGLGALMLLKNK